MFDKFINVTKSRLGYIGVSLIFLHAVIVLFSPYVAYDIFPDLLPIIIFVYLAGLCGSLVFFLIPTLNQQLSALHETKYYLLLIVSVGFILRLMILGSEPILEDDWFRYLWEGAMGNAGISPYDYSPADGFHLDDFGNIQEISADPKINKLRELSAQNGDYAYEITYPYLTTVYPAGAQAGFRLANFISPFDLNAWRITLCIAECFTLILLLKILSLWGRSSLWVSLYWWNPIITLEGLNSAHMDLLLLPPILASIIAIKKYKPGMSGILLGLGASVKIWPLLLAPLYLSPILQQKPSLKAIRDKFPALSKFAVGLIVVSGALLYPIVAPYFEPESGLGAYAGEWRKNNLLFSLISVFVTPISETPDKWARIIVAGITIILTFYLTWKLRAVDALPSAMLSVILCLYLLAPAGYPWYSIWCLPLLTISPLRGALLLSVTLPLYYLRFPLATMELDWVFNLVIAPIEFGLPILLLLYQFIHNRKSYSYAIKNT